LIGPLFNLGKSRTFMFQPKTIDRMQENRVYSNAKARRELGYAPRYSLREGLRETVQANLQSGLLRRPALSRVATALLLCALLLLAVYVLL
jgi:hypothetical protein